MKTKLMSIVDFFVRVLIGDAGTDRHGTLAGIGDALGFFAMVGLVCGLVSIYATITGAW